VHGLTRALVSNMVLGVTNFWEKKLEIVGVGYQASLNGKTLSLQVGFANTIKLPVPPNVQCEVPDNTHITVRSTDRQAAGQFAANIRRVRPPEPDKGKGIRYAGEQVRRKAGKAFGSGGK
jgi:large subunit ribosomal protein L6